MTYKEAKERFKTFGFFCDDYTDACDGDCDKCADMKRRIIESIEKQIPKKPFNDDGYVDDKKTGIHYCDSCGHFAFYSDKFCNKCGQAIDWSEEE